MKRINKLSGIVASLLLVCAWLAGCGDEEEGVPEACAEEGACAVFTGTAPIQIGFSGPLTGDYAVYSTDASRGTQLAIQDAAALHGHAFGLISGDDLGSADGAVAVANTFVANPAVVAVIGPMFSGAANAAAPIFSTANIPMVSPSATRIDLTQQGYSAFNRVIPSDLFQADTIATFLYTDLAARDLAIIHDQSTFGAALAERVRVVFTELTGDVVAFEALTPGEDDYSEILDTVADESPDSLFFGGYSAEVVVLLTQRADAGLDGIPFISDDGAYGAINLAETGDDAEGFYATRAAVPPDSAAKTAFDEAYVAAYGENPGSRDTYCWYAYDATKILVAAIGDVAIRSGGSLYIPRQALIARVRATSGYQGITGTISCDVNGECAHSGFAVFQIQDGAWGPVQ